MFNVRALTNDAPYFAAYVKTRDLPRVLDRLELLQDEWGYLLIWATLGVAVHDRDGSARHSFHLGLARRSFRGRAAKG